METLLRRQLWLVDAAAVAIAAIVSAHAVATVIAGACGNHPARGAWPSARTDHLQAAPAKTIEVILQRHIFCSACPPASAPVPAGLDPAAHRGPRPTALALRLVAVMYAPPPIDPRWSLAIIRDDDARTTAPAVLGSLVRAATVDQIDQTRVYLDFGAGRREFLDLLAPAPAANAASKSPAPARAAGAIAAPARDGILRTGERQYDIRRSTLDAWLGNLPLLASVVRVMPEIRDGKGAGIRLMSIRPEGPFAALGLRNGDVIAAINGLEMNSVEQALDAYLKLRGASHISLAVERGGQRLNQEYSIH